MNKNFSLEKIEKNIQEIKNDNKSGSAELAKKAADTFLILTKVDSKDFKEILQKTAIELTRAQPSMAIIFNLSNKILIETSKEYGEREIKKAIEEICSSFIQEINIYSHKISKTASDLIKDNQTILAHSYSSTIAEAFFEAQKNGKKFQVICTESRPIKEGVILAEKIAKKGIKTYLIVDAAVEILKNDFDLVLLGADAITKNDLVNKIGTNMITKIAYENKKPIYTLASTHKLHPEKNILKVLEQKNPKEIYEKNIAQLTPINYYFDITPLNKITGIISEEKILKPSDVQTYIKRLKTHKILQSLN